MRQIIFMTISLFAITAMAQTKAKDLVEVIYFHGKQRCVTCCAIEKLAREVVEKDFANEMKSGKVVFKVIDITTDEGAKIAKKYRVSWSSLFVNEWKEGKEKCHNMTQFAFKNARNHPDEFKKGIKEEIKRQLK
ncbi:MAG: nitrophenyl compound nitroreductase subunit ArsF family protein [Muribaculaceae bacterium]